MATETIAALDAALGELPRGVWTVIARRRRIPRGLEPFGWSLEPQAVMDLCSARRLQMQRTIIMASRYHDDHIELMIRPATRG